MNVIIAQWLKYRACELQIRSLNLPGAFDHIFWIKFLKLHVYFLSRIAFLAYLAKWHIFLIHAAILFFFFKKLFQGVLSHLNKCLYLYMNLYFINKFNENRCFMWGFEFCCYFSDFEEWPIVIQRKKALCLLLHQPSLFKTAIWWNVIPIAGPENVNHCQIYFLISAL